MIEPMSPTFSFLKTIGSIIKLSKEVYGYIKDAQGALTERDKLLSEINATMEVLSELESKATNDEWKSALDVLNTPNGPLDQFKYLLEILKYKLRPVQSTSMKAFKSATYHFSKTDIEETFSSIERLKSLFMIVLHKKQLYIKLFYMKLSNKRELSEAMKNRLGNLETMMSEIMKGKTTGSMTDIFIDQNNTGDDETQKVNEWLSVLNFSIIQRKKFELREPRTGKWFLADPEFQSWLSDEETKFLWCPGDRIASCT
jgi:hypothetical protein